MLLIGCVRTMARGALATDRRSMRHCQRKLSLQILMTREAQIGLRRRERHASWLGMAGITRAVGEWSMCVRLDQTLAVRCMRVVALRAIGAREIDPPVGFTGYFGRIMAPLAKFTGRFGKQAAVWRLVRRMTRGAFTITSG